MAKVLAASLRRTYFDGDVLVCQKALEGGTTICSDVLLSYLMKEIPTYVAYPNLAWQLE